MPQTPVESTGSILGVAPFGHAEDRPVLGEAATEGLLDARFDSQKSL
jgi:hypothetical protein